MFTRRTMISYLALPAFALALLSGASRAQTFPTWNGTYTTATKAGIITYKPIPLK